MTNKHHWVYFSVPMLKMLVLSVQVTKTAELLNSGFTIIITDRDECTHNPCHEQANCTNIRGSFRCDCNKGYSGDGFMCDSKT